MSAIRHARAPTAMAALALLGGAALAGPAEDFADGQALGQQRKTETVQAIKNGSASATDPNYNAAPPQRLYYGNANLSAQATAQQVLCASRPSDPACAAATLATTNRPKPYITIADPALAGAVVADDPSAILGNIASTYSACATDTALVSPASFALSTCRTDTAAWVHNTCFKTLTVAPKDQLNCAPGQVAGQVSFGWDYRNRNGPDLYINGGVVRVYCTPGERSTMQMGFFGGDVSEHDAGSGANFSPPPNPALLRDLDKITVPVRVNADTLVPKSGITILSGSGCDWQGACRYSMRRGKRAFALTFKKPDFERIAGDYWVNDCAPYEAQAVSATLPPDGANPPAGLALPVASTSATQQCTRTGSVCTDGPSTKTIDGIEVVRTCWQYSNSFDCTSLLASSTCNNPALGQCTQAGPAVCLVSDNTGHCLSSTTDFKCQTRAAAYTPALNCGPSTFCPGGSCYDTSAPPDADFAQTVTLLEAAREAGHYVDPTNLKVFIGYDNRCVQKLFGLVNCCKGGGTSAASAFNNLAVAAAAVGSVGKAAFSTYSYDALFASDAPDMVIRGFEALFGTGLDSGLAGLVTGDVAVSDFMLSLVPGPWTLAMLAIQVSGLLNCPPAAQTTAMKKDANLCHAVGSYCSSKILNACVETTQTHCCFASRLARIINEQGRLQLGQNWGNAQNPMCGGFTLAELQSLNFAAMDLSAFYAEIAPTLPDLATLQGGSLRKSTACYYGAGKC